MDEQRIRQLVAELFAETEHSRNETFEDKARREKPPIQFRLYKGIKGTLGALRMNLKCPYTNSDPKKKEGIVFLEMAPAIGKNVYDWDNQKMIMALSIVDIPKVILFLRNPNHSDFKTGNGDNKLSLMHDKGAGTATKGQHVKTLTISKPENMRNFMFNMYQKDNSVETHASVTVSTAEALVVATLLQSAIPTILSWV